MGKYNLLTPVKFVDRRGKSKRAYWICKCDCGNVKVLDIYSVRAGLVKSCGCLVKTIAAKRLTKHGHAKGNDGKLSPTYRTWLSMKQRCLNKNQPNYPKYGGKGITVCDQWLSFENFLKDMGDRPGGKILNRINTAEGYFLENCRWARPGENKKGQEEKIAYNGKVYSLSQLAGHLANLTNKSKVSVYASFKKGWTAEEILAGASDQVKGKRISHLVKLYAKYSSLIEDGRHKSVFEYRIGVVDGKPHTLAETGNIFKISRERARQIIELCVNKMYQGYEKGYARMNEQIPS